MTKQLLMEELIRDEGTRLTVYDDATGQPITKAVKVVGHPTIGVGRALDVNGITPTEARYLLNNDIDRTVEALEVSLPWFGTISDARQRVLANMAFNMGTVGLMKFTDTLRYIGEGRYELAAKAMEDSHWYQQVGERGKRLAEMMRNG